MYDKKIIEEIKEKVNMYDFVSQHTELSLVGHNVWGGNCPHPDHNDGTPSFRLWLNEDGSWSWSCMGCHCGKKDSSSKNYGSDIFAYMQWMSDHKGSDKVISFGEALRILAKRLDITITSDVNQAEYIKLQNVAKLCHSKLMNNKEALLYLTSRGLDEHDILEWCIGYAELIEGPDKRVVPRITFPLMDEYKSIVGFSSRKLPTAAEEVPKYKNSKNSNIFNKSKFLFGFHRVDKRERFIYITEGVMDVILATKYGLKNVVATLGTSFTTEHVEMIKKTGLNPCFCMDADAAGIKGAEKAIKMLADAGISSYICVLPNGMDLADTAANATINFVSIITQMVKPYWLHAIAKKVEIYEAEVNTLRAKLLPDILEATENVSTMQDRILLSSYVKEKLGITL